MNVAALFVREDSIYKTLGIDCYDINRDARKFRGDCPVIAHPPCRLYSRMRHFSTAPQEEKRLALFAVGVVWRNGGVLEHPYLSTLCDQVGLPYPGRGQDDHFGFSIDVDQHWFGHRCRKRTWLYICGIRMQDVPDYTIRFSEPTHVVGRSRNSIKPHCTKKERDATPREFAEWLIKIAELCQRKRIDFVPRHS
jgi:hypothetical protein